MMSEKDQFAAELVRLGTYLRREGGRVTREFGITQQQFVVLKTIQEHEPTAQKNIVSDLLYNKAHVSKAVTFLEKKGLISTRRNPEDHRIVTCSSTREGRRLIEKCMARFRALHADWLRHVSDKDIHDILPVLRSLGRKS